MPKTQVEPAAHAILEARHHDPFEVLGRHVHGDRARLRVFLPRVREVYVADGDLPLTRVEGTDLFEGDFALAALPERYRLRWIDNRGAVHEAYDPYCFPPQVGDLDLHLFGEGRHRHAYRFLGAHPRRIDGVAGVQFSVWAPAAERVSVVGDFNAWDGRVHAMRVRGGSGVWELFIPGIDVGALYKFEIRNRDTGRIMVKLDPYAQACQYRPDNAGIVHLARHEWQDQTWMQARATHDWQHQPMSIYEVHLGSWKRNPDGSFVGYRQLAEELVEYVAHLGFTHIELLPVTEHPLDASWGYQTTGYYAATSRFGAPDDFRWFVDHCHQHGIGVLLDWAPGHFPKDETALARFDGTALYEHADPRKGEHRDWGTYIFNYGRNEVRNFLVSSAFFWLDEFHIDGLRVDAVASMLYLDYSREAGDWVANQYGGRENLEAIDFLREMNRVVHGEHPGAVVIAEESTAWPQVTRPDYLGGLGFSMKWNMGWMHDTLAYMSHDPVHRSYHHDMLTFGMMYAFTENFVLPFSHDEVVHLKGSMLTKMPGDAWQQFANLRLLYAYQWTYPGKKLLFMGSEFAQGKEWNFDHQLEWWQLDVPYHRGVFTLMRDLNRLYRELPALHALEFDGRGFEWIDCHDSSQSIVSYQRKAGPEAGDGRVVVIINFTPVPRYDYRIGLPAGGAWREVLNTDAEIYGGGNVGNNGMVHAEATPWMNLPWSASLMVPPLAAVILTPA